MTNRNLLSLDSQINLFSLQNQLANEPLPSLPSLDPTDLKSFGGSQVKSTSRKLMRSKTPSQKIKENILKRRQSLRVQQLKQVTSNNLNMFLRIKSQSSHYKFQDLHRQSCGNITHALLPRPPRPATSTSQAKNTIRCQFDKQSLISRCASLKQNICSRAEQNRVDEEQQEGRKEIPVRTILFKKKTSTCNKQNQLVNGIKPVQSRFVASRQVVQNAIAKKLGQPIPKSNQKVKIIINPNGQPHQENSKALQVKTVHQDEERTRKVQSQRRNRTQLH